MKLKSIAEGVDELRSEYDLTTLMSGAVLGKYAPRCRKGMNVVVLDREVAEAFPTHDAVNDALRLVMRLACLPTLDRSARSSRAVPSARIRKLSKADHGRSRRMLDGKVKVT